MGIEIRLPNINAATEREQLIQLKSYLYQLSEQLQWAFDNINTTGGSSSSGYVVNQPTKIYSKGLSNAEAELTFNSLKSLIIKSADIVNAYYDEINARLEGIYVAQSDFGAYAEKTSQEIEATSTSTTQRFENIQVIITGMDQDIGSINGSLETIGQDLSYAQQDIISLGGTIDTIDSTIVVLEGNVSDLDTNLQSTKQELQTTVQNTKAELSGTIDSAKTELNSTIEGAKSELNSAISTTVEGAKTELNQAISSSVEGAKAELNTNIDTAKEELNGNIESTKSELNSNISNAESNAYAYADAAEESAKGYTDSAASELNGKIGETASELAGKIDDTNGRIDETDGKVSDLGDGLDNANSRIDGVDKDLQDSKTNITTEIQRVTDSVSTVDKLRLAAEEALRGSIDDLVFDLAGLKQIVVGVTAYIKSGLVYYTDAGIPVYGIEIGQEVETNGTTVFNKFARFTSEKLSFYDSNGSEVAYISDKKLYIGQAEVTISFKIGRLIDLVQANGDVVTKWEGG